MNNREKSREKARRMERKRLHRILDLAIEKNEGTASVFLEFAGHVNLVSMSIHKEGWKIAQGASVKLDHYLDKPYGDSLESFEKALKEC